MATQAANDGMLLLATGATNVDVTQKGSTIFRNCFIDPYQGKMAALFVKSKGFSKVAVIYAKDDDYSNGLKDAFVENCEANGIEITYTGECMSTDTDFSSQAAQAVASGAEFLYYPCFLDTVPLLVGAARNAGFTGTIMAAMPGMARIPPAWKTSLMTATLPTTTPARIPPPPFRTLCRSTPKSTAPKA